MTTAREKLFDEVMALSASPAGPEAEGKIKKLMLQYRVQTKPGVKIDDGVTARDALGDLLLELWRTSPADKEAQVGNTIDRFRMQLKGKAAGAPAKPKASAPKPASTAKAPAAAPRPSRPADPPAEPMRMPDPMPLSRSRRPSIEPVAGGPRRRGKTRSECPKCHSMGVVLARSYAGDEYFSCIYCGWQAYKPADENDPTASLASRLLGGLQTEAGGDSDGDSDVD